jgi:hypothetical protein
MSPNGFEDRFGMPLLMIGIVLLVWAIRYRRTDPYKFWWKQKQPKWKKPRH